MYYYMLFWPMFFLNKVNTLYLLVQDSVLLLLTLILFLFIFTFLLELGGWSNVLSCIKYT